MISRIFLSALLMFKRFVVYFFRRWPFFSTATILMLASCSLLPGVSAPVKKDGAPKTKLSDCKIQNAIPRVEPLSRGGNPETYTVWGKTYRVLKSANGFVERGIASWYGTAFHGNPTSNGERYDMYEMTAAHKHLPLPSYVEVHNLENDRKVIVRVNDRGPFVHGRIIDLSYAAATKLGMLGKGTARVEIEVLDPRTFSMADWDGDSRCEPLSAVDSRASSHSLVYRPAQQSRTQQTIAEQSVMANANGTALEIGRDDAAFSSPAGISSDSVFYIQLATYSQPDVASKELGNLRLNLVHSDWQVDAELSPYQAAGQSELWQRLRLGPFATLADAESALQAPILSRYGKIYIVSE